MRLIPFINFTALADGYKGVNESISSFGVPEQIHSDQGREFDSEIFKKICQEKSRTLRQTWSFYNLNSRRRLSRQEPVSINVEIRHEIHSETFYIDYDFMAFLITSLH